MQIIFPITLAIALSLTSGISMAAQGDGDASGIGSWDPSQDKRYTPGGGWSPFQFSLFSPVQLFGKEKDIKGLRLNLLYGENADISGIDLGLGVNSSRNVTGIQIAGFANSVSHDATGIQIGLFGNQVDGEMKGIQIGGINNAFIFFGGHWGWTAAHRSQGNLEVTGAQIGYLNYAVNLDGVQIGLLINSADNARGVQIGLVNEADYVRGVQIGIYNSCKNLKGIQIGLLNHIENGRFPYLPILNAQF